MTALQHRLANPTPIDSRLIQPRKDHTLIAYHVKPALLPCMLYLLKTNKKLTIVRAMNYSRALYRQIGAIEVYRLINLFKNVPGGISALTFYSRVAPSTFNNYSYWYSRFLFHITQFNYDDKYRLVCDINVEVVRKYLFSECNRGLKPETVDGILSAIKHFLRPFRNSFAAFLFYDTYELDSLKKSLYNIYGRPRKERIQITYHILAKIVKVVQMDVIKDVRDWFVLILTHVGGFRGGEVAPAKWVDLLIDKYIDTFTGYETDIMILFIKKTKTEKNGVVVTISVPRGHSGVYNPLFILYLYINMLQDLGYTGSFIFPSLRKKDLNKEKPISRSTMNKNSQELWGRTGGNPKDINLHGSRGGMVEDAVARGIPESLIQKHGRWKSQVWRSYFHDQDYAHACVSSQLVAMSKDYESKVTSKKQKQILKYLSKQA